MDRCVSAVAGGSSSARVHRGSARETAAPPGELRLPTVATSWGTRWSTGLGPTSGTCGGTQRPTA
eukprot:6232775-Alexandrium_andersonii.AAC.1